MATHWKRTYLEIVTGRRRGAVAMAARTGLAAASLLYGGVLALRNGAFALGLRRRHHMPGPVVGVGNITLGGTGKTPMVELLVRRFEARGLRVAVASRGYGRQAGGVDDEAFDAGFRVTGPDRLANCRRAFGELRADLVVLDDGFQDLRLHRDLDIAMVDASDPFGAGRLFPRGLLRESPRALRRADLIVVSRADMLNAGELALLRDQLATLSGGRPTAAAVHRPRPPQALAGDPAPDLLAGRRILGFCGVGNPLGFEATLRAQKARVAAFRAFPDHHPYSETELDGLEAEARELEVDALVTTEKDAARLSERGWTVPVWVLGVDLDIVAGQENFETALARVETALRQARVEAP
ncbi:MAG: tetraacyldisaccharide 4'-kinase [Planctomycetes bacterium]|nr:tetraacyldisaccharide 4'-kinase [Planctomycetota bacterium]